METSSHGPGQSRESAEPEQALVLHDTYRLVRQVGFGGMGVVYEAIHTRLPRRFAIKVLLRSLLSHPEAHARFCREAEVMSQLRHPNIVQIFDFNVTHENQPYFVMEYLDGRSLESELADGAAMPLSRALPMVEAVASALMTAHRHGIMHRDLKPSNIFLCDVEDTGAPDGEALSAPALRAEHPFVKLLDFGVSPGRASGHIVLGSNVVETSHYLAPEQAGGRGKTNDARADQFALAAITYEMLAGQHAFTGEDAVSLLHQIVHEEPQALDRLVGWDCWRVQQVLSRALAKDPARRFPTILDFSDALQEAADHARAPVTPPPVLIASPPAIAAPRPLVALDTPASGQPWSEREITQTIPRVPRLAYRPIVIGLAAVAVLGFVAVKGWVYPLPPRVVTAAQNVKVRLFGAPPALPSPPSLPSPPPVAVPIPPPSAAAPQIVTTPATEVTSATTPGEPSSAPAKSEP